VKFLKKRFFVQGHLNINNKITITMIQYQKKINSALFIFIAFINFGCSEDFEVINQTNYDGKIKVKPIALQDVQKNSIAFEKLTIPKSRLNSSLSSNRIINDTINNFSIETNYGVYIETDNYHSYTFKVLRPNGSNYLLENIVISKLNALEYETILYQYDITEHELHMIDHGEFVDLQGKINKIFLENSNITTEVTGKYYYNGHCYEDNPVYVTGQTCQGEGFLNHTYEEVLAGQDCSQFGTSVGPQPGYYTWQTIEVACDDNGGGGSGGTSSHNGGSGGTGGPRAITTPINNCITGNCIDENATDPCEKIKKLQDDTNFKNRMANLIDAARNWNFERCIVMYNATTPTLTNNYTYQTFDGTANSPESGYNGNTTMQGIIHSHYDGLLSIFSAGDLQDLYFKLKNYPEITDDFFMGVVTASNTAYLLQVPDRATFIAFGDKYLSDKNKLNKFMEEIMLNRYNIENENSNDANELGFLKMMADLNMGVSLASVDFNANTPATGTVFNSWTKKEYDKRTRTVNPSNCN
jgi:hypothetical protein